MELTGARRCGSEPVKSNRTPSRVDRDPHREPHGAVGESVVVDVPFGDVLAPRQRGELGARSPVGVGDELVHVETHGLRPVAFEQGRQAPHAGVVGRELRPEVARRLALGADLGQDEPEHVVDDLAIPHHLHRGNDHPFLVDLAECADARRGAPAHVHVMGEVAEVAVNLALVEERGDHHDVVEVSAARIGVVDHELIARAEVLGPVVEDSLAHRPHHRAEVVGLAEGLRDGTKVAVEQAARKVAAGLDVGGVGAAPQRERHLLGRFEKAVAEHLELDRVDLHWGTPSCRGRFMAVPGPAGGRVTVAPASRP